MATVSIATVKARIKTILDATGDFGSVYTEERRRVDNPLKPYVMMWTDGGSQDVEAGDDLMRQPVILIRIFVPEEPGPSGDVDLQTTMDSAFESAADALRAKPKLNTDSGDGPLVIDSLVESWTQRYDPELKRGVVELRFRAKWLEE